MNQERFNQICINELNSRVKIKAQRGTEWSENDDKRFMNWFTQKTEELFGLDLYSSRAKFFMFMIDNSPLR